MSALQLYGISRAQNETAERDRNSLCELFGSLTYSEAFTKQHERNMTSLSYQNNYKKNYKENELS